MDYNSCGDFLQDERFVQWVKGIDESSEQIWLDWINSNPEKVHIINEATYFVKSIDYLDKEGISKVDSDTILKSILNHPPIELTQTKMRFPVKQLLVAASVFLAILTSYFAIRPDLNDQEVTTEIEWIEKSIPFGQKKTLILSDGSEIKINSGGRLKFPKVFTDNYRIVELHGEAFFKVTSNPSRPFVVKVGQLNVEVLGTSFNVRYNKELGSIEVALTEGKLVINDSMGNTIMLEPNESLLYESERFEKERFSSEKVLAWLDGKIFFENSSSEEVVQTLEQWYGVEFIVDDNSNFITHRYNGLYDKETLKNILQGLSFTYEFDYKIEGKKVVIK